MNHEQAAQALWDYHDGQMPPQEKRAFEAHVALCGDCRQTLESWSRISSRLFNTAPAATSAQTEAFVRSVMSRLEAQPRSFDVGNFWSLRWLVPVGAAGLAASALLIAPLTRSLPDPAEALMQQDEGASELLSWLSGPQPTRGDAFSLMAEEK